MSRITILCQIICSPMLKNTCVRRVALDKWSPPIAGVLLRLLGGAVLQVLAHRVVLRAGHTFCVFSLSLSLSLYVCYVMLCYVALRYLMLVSLLVSLSLSLFLSLSLTTLSIHNRSMASAVSPLKQRAGRRTRTVRRQLVGGPRVASLVRFPGRRVRAWKTGAAGRAAATKQARLPPCL